MFLRLLCDRCSYHSTGGFCLWHDSALHDEQKLFLQRDKIRGNHKVSILVYLWFHVDFKQLNCSVSVIIYIWFPFMELEIASCHQCTRSSGILSAGFSCGWFILLCGCRWWTQMQAECDEHKVYWWQTGKQNPRGGKTDKNKWEIARLENTWQDYKLTANTRSRRSSKTRYSRGETRKTANTRGYKGRNEWGEQVTQTR